MFAFLLPESANNNIAIGTKRLGFEIGAERYQQSFRRFNVIFKYCYQCIPKWVEDLLSSSAKTILTVAHRTMKLIFAIIQPTKLRTLKQALGKIGVNRITICDAQEFAKHSGHEPVYRGVEYRTDILRKISIEIAVNDDYLDRTVSTIESVARTGTQGSYGDGKIFVINIEQAISFDPETRGPGAI